MKREPLASNSFDPGWLHALRAVAAKFYKTAQTLLHFSSDRFVSSSWAINKYLNMSESVPHTEEVVVVPSVVSWVWVFKATGIKEPTFRTLKLLWASRIATEGIGLSSGVLRASMLVTN